MEHTLIASVLSHAHCFADTSSIACAVFDYTYRNFVPEAPVSFCKNCAKAANGDCIPQHTHLYGCFEAERWSGLYIYYCPLGLTFVSTVIHEDSQAAYALISGPLCMGTVADIVSDNGGLMLDEILQLPIRTPGQVNSLARTQKALCMFLSSKDAAWAHDAAQGQFKLMNTLYDVTKEMKNQGQGRYPVEIEQQLQHMIVQGDKDGARELINQLLGHLYFNTSGDFPVIKERAKELVILFSRASIEGGADIQQIFGQNRNIMSEIDRFDSLDQLSTFLTSIFYRFVSYVFDFSNIEHTDIMHKAVNFVRENYACKLTLDDVAEHVYLSRSYLSKLFKEELGVSFTDFVNNIRVEKSKALLQNHSLALAEIADLVGFSDQSYFTKVFSKSVGMSPGQYRKNRGQARSSTPNKL